MGRHVADAMIDRRVHHTDVIAIKGDSTGSRITSSAVSRPRSTPTETNRRGSILNRR